MTSFPAGKLDRRITIRRRAVSADPVTGLPVEAWSDLATVWASWRRASARETLAAAEIGAQVTDVFEVRWSPMSSAITPLDRLIYQGREYNISDAREIGRRVGIRITGMARGE